jgi:hypothetical protein
MTFCDRMTSDMACHHARQYHNDMPSNLFGCADGIPPICFQLRHSNGSIRL